jgi:adenosine deaminase
VPISDPNADGPIPIACLRAIPKTDLHVHLDGSLRVATLIELARAAGVSLPSYTEAGLKETVFKATCANLPEYLAGFAYTCAVMRQAEHIERIAYELAQDNLAEGVRYVEMRFAPQLHIHSGLKAREVDHLAEYIASRRIALEVCLTSNLQTLPHLRIVAAHPLTYMLERNLSVSICTDNRLVSDTTVCRELERAAAGAPMTPKQLRNTVIAGFKGSFFPGSYDQKRAYVRRVIDRYDELAQQYGVGP